MITRSAFYTLTYISAFSGLLPLISCIARFKILSRTLNVLLFYLCVTVLVEAIGFLLSTYNIQNYSVKNIYTFTECTCICLMYYLQIKNSLVKKILVSVYVIFLTLSVLLLVLMKAYNRPDHVINSLEGWIVLMTGSYYLFELYSDLSIQSLSGYYFTWINAGLLIYFSASLFMFFFNDYIEKIGLARYYKIYSIHLTANILLNILISIGVWKTTPIRTSC